MSGRTFELFRFTHPDGSAKEWACAHTGAGLCEVRWGRAGRLSNAQRDVPQSAARRRVQEKLGKGYRYVGDVQIGADGLSGRPKSQERAPAPNPAATTATQARTPIDVVDLLGGDDPGFYF